MIMMLLLVLFKLPLLLLDNTNTEIALAACAFVVSLFQTGDDTSQQQQATVVIDGSTIGTIDGSAGLL